MNTKSTPSTEKTFAAKPARCVKRLKPIPNPLWRGYGAGTPAGVPAGKPIRCTWLNRRKHNRLPDVIDRTHALEPPRCHTCPGGGAREFVKRFIRIAKKPWRHLENLGVLCDLAVGKSATA